MRAGALIGYARVSTTDQLLDRQQRALAEADCLRVFADASIIPDIALHRREAGEE